MSIESEIRSAVDAGRLFKLSPYVPVSGALREIYVTAELNAELSLYDGADTDGGAPELAKNIKRLAQLRSHLEQFLNTPQIDEEYLKPLDPPGKAVWEIRSRRPKPSIRVFGMLPAKDIFIATHLAERKTLGGWKSYDFTQEISKCRRECRNLFPYHQGFLPAVRGRLSSVITGGLDENLQ